MTRAEEECLKLIADLIGVERKDLDDPEKFPLDSIITVFEGLSRNGDLSSFLARLDGMMQANPEMQTASREASNS